MFDFYSLTKTDLSELLKKHFNAPKFTASQLFEWVYKRGVSDFSLMTNLSKELRAKMESLFSFEEAKKIEREISMDGTRKYLFQVSKDHQVETVMIKQTKRMTLCISSQKGCAMGCSFCQTAQMGFQGNLTAGDIVRQVLAVKKDALNFNDDFQNIVFMGMGEPLHNFKGVTDAMSILLDVNGLAIGPRKITVSSVGLVPAIQKFGNLDTGINLAISLNATTDEVRSSIMPINRKYNLNILLDCLRNFPLRAKKKITIEYVMLAGINDTDADLKRLPKLLKNIPAKVNLIPYNNNADLGFRTPSRKKVLSWNHDLIELGINSTIRWSKGEDINAACGQLHAEVNQVNRTKSQINSSLVQI